MFRNGRWHREGDNADKSARFHADIKALKETNFKYKADDKVIDEESGKKYMVLSSYIQDGQVRYTVYPPGKKTSVGYHIWVKESDLVNSGNDEAKKPAKVVSIKEVARKPENKPRLAPNGKPSNLNAMQHAQVRTAKFKEWFGDWETSARQSFLREYFTKALNDNQWQSRIVIAEGANADPSGRLSETFGFKVIKQLSSPDDIRKTNKRHGEGNERKQDQIGLTVDDYIKAIEVLRNPESFKKTISNNGKPSAEFGRSFQMGQS